MLKNIFKKSRWSGASAAINSYGEELTEQEVLYHLNQKERLGIKPQDASSIVKLNSTFYEASDNLYAWRGVLTFVFLLSYYRFYFCYFDDVYT